MESRLISLKETVFVTVVTANHFHYALALRDSISNAYGEDSHLLIVLIDPDTFKKSGTVIDDEFVDAKLLPIANWDRFSFQYTAFELSCAIKPFAIQYLFNQGVRKVVYIDADCYLYSRLHSIDRALESHSIALSPHLIESLPADEKSPREILFLSAGAFNGGVVGCLADEPGKAFIRWWMDRLSRDCYIDLARGIFVDQKWLDIVPALFPRSTINRSPACNTGYWTLQQFDFSGSEVDGYFVGGERLECFHFSNFLPKNPYQFLRSQERFTFQSLPALKELVENYHAKLSVHDRDFSKLCYSMSELSDGTAIKAEWREALRRNHPTFADIKNPFDVTKTPKIAKQFALVERESRKWRGDWQIMSPKKRERRENRRKNGNFWRSLKQRFFGR